MAQQPQAAAGAGVATGCGAQADPFYLIQGGRVHLFGTAATPGAWAAQPVIVVLPPNARPTFGSRLFCTMGFRRGNATAAAASSAAAAGAGSGGQLVGVAGSVGLVAVWVRVHEMSGQVEVVAAAGAEDVAWISLSGIAFDVSVCGDGQVTPRGPRQPTFSCTCQVCMQYC